MRGTMSSCQHKLLNEYLPPSYTFETVHLKFFLEEDKTIVQSRILVKPTKDDGAPLVLDGSNLKALYVKINGEEAKDLVFSSSNLTLHSPPSCPFELEIGTEIHPRENLSNEEGLYYSPANSYFVTQCEATGFSKITFYQDRPDVMAKFTVRIEAAKEQYPILLCNGNLMESGDNSDGVHHYCVWSDPFPKPCYLFALVAGNFACREDLFVTHSGRRVKLCIWSPPDDVPLTEFAMVALKAAMKWDEDVYGLEYDLDIFNIVSLPDAFMGAMENKSLNIFNAKFLLASKWISTDADIALMSRIVAHEYFHNWTGNRVTCRDWFQLSLKEGLTDFREQEFCSDTGCRSIQRIESALSLRQKQFPEDSGPLAHPVRPDSYIEVDNLYTATVYEKGAEVIRMYQTLLGKDGFRKGLQLYIERHDGEAVTCEDFYRAMCDANSADLSSFMLWYTQAGTPCVTVRTAYDPEACSFTLHCRQDIAPTPGQHAKSVVLIPLAVGLLDHDGRDIRLSRVLVDGVESVVAIENSRTDVSTALLSIEKMEHEFTFLDVPERPVPSLLRNFSAPVQLVTTDLTHDNLLFLFTNDSDEFNRWDAGQRIGKSLMLELVRCFKMGEELRVPAAYLHAIRNILNDSSLDKEFIAHAITLPDESELINMMEVADPNAIHHVRRFLVKKLAMELKPDLLRAVVDNRNAEPYEFNSTSRGRRALKNAALYYLAALDEAETTELAFKECKHATNLTEQLGALAAIAQNPGQARDRALADFYEQWKHERLVVNKWLRLQSAADTPNNVELVRLLMDHPSFDARDGTKVVALVGGFFNCLVNFHAEDGSGYEFMGDVVPKLDKFHPKSLSISVGRALANLRRFDSSRQALAKAQLQRIASTKDLSKTVLETVSKCLEA